MEVKLSFHRHHTSLCLLCIYRNVFDGIDYHLERYIVVNRVISEIYQENLNTMMK